MRSATPALVLAALLPASAALAGPRGTVVHVDDPSTVDPHWNAPMAAGGQSDVIFLNRCVGGCTVYGGGNDSRTNQSFLADSGTNVVSEFEHGDADWDFVVRCVRDIYEPYGITITTTDPGSAPHFEAIVAGTPSEIGQPSGVGGVAPGTCDVWPNSITFSFANYYNDPQEICVTVAQETAHAFGLDHEYLCLDPMTYRNDCTNKKYFQDVDAPCGEDGPRGCSCGGSTQNSHETLLAIWGPGTPTPPTVEFIRPRANQTVNPNFAIEVNADDNVAVDTVELLINGKSILTTNLKPFIFNAPPDTPGGTVVVEVRATDNRGESTTESVTVTQGDPCTDGSCPDELVCLSGNCVAGPGSPGGLGATCDGNDDCDSNMCADDGSEKLCAAPCGDGCPSGFSCRGEDGPSPVCWPGEDGGCSASPTARTVPWHLLVGIVAGFALLARPRRRRDASR